MLRGQGRKGPLPSSITSLLVELARLSSPQHPCCPEAAEPQLTQIHALLLISRLPPPRLPPLVPRCPLHVRFWFHWLLEVLLLGPSHPLG